MSGYNKKLAILQQLQHAIKRKINDKSKGKQLPQTRMLQQSVQKRGQMTNTKLPSRQNRVVSSFKTKQNKQAMHQAESNLMLGNQPALSIFTQSSGQSRINTAQNDPKLTNKKTTSRRWQKLLSLINYMLSSSDKAIKYISSTNFQAQFAVKLFKSDKQNLVNQIRNFNLEQMANQINNSSCSKASKQSVSKDTYSQVCEQNLKLKKQIVLLQKQAECFHNQKQHNQITEGSLGVGKMQSMRQVGHYQSFMRQILEQRGFSSFQETVCKQRKFQSMLGKCRQNDKKVQQLRQIVSALRREKRQIFCCSLKQPVLSEVQRHLRAPSQGTSRSSKMRQIHNQKQLLNQEIQNLKAKLEAVKNIEKVEKENVLLKNNHQVLYRELNQILRKIDPQFQTIDDQAASTEELSSGVKSSLLEGIHNNIRAKQQALGRMADQLQDMKASFQQQRQDYQANFRQVLQERDRINEGLDQYKLRTEQNLTQYKTQIQRLNNAIRFLQSQEQSSQSDRRQVQLKGRIAQLCNQAVGLSQSLEERQRKCEHLGKRVEDLQGQLLDKENELHQKKTSLLQSQQGQKKLKYKFSQQLQAQKRKVSSQRQKIIAEMQLIINQRNNSIKGMQEQLIHSNAKLSLYQSNINLMNQKIQQLQDQMQSQEHDRETRQLNEIKQLNGRMSGYRIQVMSLKDIVAKNEQELQAKNQEIIVSKQRQRGEIAALVNQYNTLVNQHDTLVNEHNTLVNEHNALINEHNTLSNQHNDELARLTHQCHNLNVQGQNLNQQLTLERQNQLNILSQLIQSKQESNRLERQVEQLNSQLAELQSSLGHQKETQINGLQNSLSLLSQQINKLTLQKNVLVEQLEVQRNNHANRDNQLQQLRSICSQVQNEALGRMREKEAKDQEIDQWNRKAQQSEQRIFQTNKKCEYLQMTIDLITKQNQSLTNQLSHSHNKIQNIQGQYCSLQKQLTQKTNQLLATTQQLKQKTTQSTLFNLQLQTSKGKMQQLQQSLTQNCLIIATLQRQLQMSKVYSKQQQGQEQQNLMVQITSLKHNLDYSQSRIIQLNEQLAQVTKQSAQLNKQSQQLKKQLQQLDKQLAQLKKQNDKLATQLLTTRSSITHLTQQKEKQGQRLQQVQQKLLQLQQKLSGHQRSMEQLQRQNEKLQKQNQQLQSQYEQLQQQLNSSLQLLEQMKLSLEKQQKQIHELELINEEMGLQHQGALLQVEKQMKGWKIKCGEMGQKIVLFQEQKHRLEQETRNIAQIMGQGHQDEQAQSNKVKSQQLVCQMRDLQAVGQRKLLVIAQLQLQISNLESQLKDASALTSTITNQNQQQIKSNRQLVKQLDDKQQQFRQFQQQFRRRLKQQSERGMKQLNEENKQIKNQIQALNQEKQRYRMELITSNSRVSQLLCKQAQLALLQTYLQTMQIQLTSLKQQKNKQISIHHLKLQQYVFLLKKILQSTKIEFQDLKDQASLDILLQKGSQRIVRMKKRLRDEQSNQKKLDNPNKYYQHHHLNSEHANAPIHQFNVSEGRSSESLHQQVTQAQGNVENQLPVARLFHAAIDQDAIRDHGKCMDSQPKGTEGLPQQSKFQQVNTYKFDPLLQLSYLSQIYPNTDNLNQWRMDSVRSDQSDNQNDDQHQHQLIKHISSKQLDDGENVLKQQQQVKSQKLSGENGNRKDQQQNNISDFGEVEEHNDLSSSQLQIQQHDSQVQRADHQQQHINNEDVIEEKLIKQNEDINYQNIEKQRQERSEQGNGLDQFDEVKSSRMDGSFLSQVQDQQGQNKEGQQNACTQFESDQKQQDKEKQQQQQLQQGQQEFSNFEDYKQSSSLNSSVISSRQEVEDGHLHQLFMQNQRKEGQHEQKGENLVENQFQQTQNIQKNQNNQQKEESQPEKVQNSHKNNKSNVMDDLDGFQDYASQHLNSSMMSNQENFQTQSPEQKPQNNPQKVTKGHKIQADKAELQEKYKQKEQGQQQQQGLFNDFDDYKSQRLNESMVSESDI